MLERSQSTDPNDPSGVEVAFTGTRVSVKLALETQAEPLSLEFAAERTDPKVWASIQTLAANNQSALKRLRDGLERYSQGPGADGFQHYASSLAVAKIDSLKPGI